MNVNFKGLYVIPGSEKSLRGTGESLQNISEKKLTSFLESTKPYRSQSGYSFYDRNTGDYYIAVSDMWDYEFEGEAKDYNINIYKVGSKLVRNNSPFKDEADALLKARTNSIII